MSHKTECPWCGQVLGDYERLARHLTRRYRQRRPCLSLIRPHRTDRNKAQCICPSPFGHPAFFWRTEAARKKYGTPDSKGVPTLAEHLRSAGGASAHLLAVTLGVERDV